MKEHLSLSPDTVIKRSENIAWQKFEDKVFIITPDDSMLHMLNETGTRIWEIIEKPKKISEIVEEILKEYDVTKEKAEQSVKRFISELIKKGICEISA